MQIKIDRGMMTAQENDFVWREFAKTSELGKDRSADQLCKGYHFGLLDLALSVYRYCFWWDDAIKVGGVPRCWSFKWTEDVCPNDREKNALAAAGYA